MPEHRLKEPVTDLHARALDHLDYIRSTMAASHAFTAVPGLGMVKVGAIGLAAALLTAIPALNDAWLAVWITACAAAVVVGGSAMIEKARETGTRLLRGVGLRFLLGLAPPIAAAALLTAVLLSAGASAIVPGLWLLLYGVAVIGGGAFSIPLIPAMGALFVLLSLAAFRDPAAANLLLGLGFGGLHIVFGWLIAHRYGG